ncbi:protein scarlet-like [Neodiprion fabricii]|uniref:protein scarlet-like n=1 Tax=Neodiprion fabricii TaxID=2872261 RepID=UPI001ED9360F|nr:protein scarlet-like [Neodiprion fabricii]
MRVRCVHCAVNSEGDKTVGPKSDIVYLGILCYKMFLKDVESESYSPPPELPISISWENITVHVRRKPDFFIKSIAKKIFGYSTRDDKPIKILDSVTGHADSSSLVAVMGPSGAGKTTLLAALARKIELHSGCIRVNGCSVSRDLMSKIAGFVPQFCALPPALTAMEYMIFTCALRLDKGMSAKDRNTLAVNILTDLGILKHRDTQISKLSGGEVKRLSLAVEMVTKPKILFLDEPTSGLDTWTAMRVIESAKAATRSGTIVFCSVHQPAMDLYKMFSHVVYLANGRTAYYGTLVNARKFFNSEGFHCPESFNEAEFYVKIVSTMNLVDSLNATDSFLLSERLAKICSSFTRSTYYNPPEVPAGNGSIEFKSQTLKPNQLVQFYWLMWRISIQMRRTVFHEAGHYYPFLVSSILISWFYFGVNSHTQVGVQDMRGALYLISAEIIFSSTYSNACVLSEQLPLYLQENSMYTPAVYYIATVISWIPKIVCHCILFFSIMLVSLDMDINFFVLMKFVTCIILAALTSSAYGSMMSSWIENPDIMMSIMGPIDLVGYLMSGVYYNIRAMPAYLSWVKYLSIFYYANEALAIIHWTTVDSIECYPDKDLPCYRNGREVLTEYGYGEDNLKTDLCGLILLTFGMHFVGYLGVRRLRIVRAMY